MYQFEAPLFASVVKANATVTEYALHCGIWRDGSVGDCDRAESDNPPILTVGPSTMILTGVYPYVYAPLKLPI